MDESLMTGAIADPSDAMLRLHDVTVRYDDTVALDRLSFEMRQGDTVVLLGAAGSGKTVLLKTALRLIQPDEGAVYLFGRDTTGMRERELNNCAAAWESCFRKAACSIR